LISPPSGRRGIKSAILLSKAFDKCVEFVAFLKRIKVDVWFAISGEMFVKLRVGSRVGRDCVDQNNIEINTITIPATVGLHILSPYLDR
jgi:hypothetical protein